MAQKVYEALHNKQRQNNIEISDIPIGKLIIPDSIVFHLKPREQYANFFRALVGKNAYRDKSTKDVIYVMATYAGFLPPIMNNNSVQICQTSFDGFGGQKHAVQLRTINVNGQRKNFFPYLSTKTVMTFSTQEIHEWESDKGFNTEAEIKGIVADKIALSFFAADYAVKKDAYCIKASLKVHLSAFAFEVYCLKTENERLTANKAPGITLSPKIVGCHNLYDFTGYVLIVKAARISLKNTGYIVSIKLFDHDLLNIVDVFVNAENIISGQIKRNIMVKGTLWLQGEIASQN